MRGGISGMIRRAGEALCEAVFPAVCECCGASLVRGEKLLCLQCQYDMPRTGCHRDSFSDIHKRIAAPGVPVERAAAMFHYVKESRYALLIQRAKYNDRPSIVRHLAGMFARELEAEHFFEGVDMLLPVPLHRRKLLRRGFNQSEEIAMAISTVTSIPVGDNLKSLPHSTQTRKNAMERAANMNGTICVTDPEELAGLHVLIVDDVITTGATLLAAAKAIRASSPTTRISVLTLAESKLLY